MKPVPIIFRADMIRALLREAEAPGTGKSQTRRLAWRGPLDINDPVFRGLGKSEHVGNGENFIASIWQRRYDRWQAGERDVWLWVRETFLAVGGLNPERARIVYRATNDGPDAWVSPVWRPPIHMPRWASRLSLRITDMRLERLQSITGAEIKAEGIEPAFWGTGILRDKFVELWDSIHGPGSFDSNPEVIVTDFAGGVHLANIDEVRR